MHNMSNKLVKRGDNLIKVLVHLLDSNLKQEMLNKKIKLIN